MSNGYGDFQTTAQADQAAHDRCPTRLRHAMNYAVGPYAAVVVLRQFKEISKRMGQPIATQMIVDAIRRGDRSGTIDAYGPTHPEAMQ